MALFTTEYECIFGRSDSEPRYGSGWCRPEASHTWTAGTCARLYLPTPAPAAWYLLEASVFTWCHALINSFQRLIVRVNGVVVGAGTLAEGKHFLAWRVDGTLCQDRFEIQFETPDAFSPSAVDPTWDTRTLAVAFTRLRLTRGNNSIPPPVERPVANVTAAFESIGNNCEFANVQRQDGIDPVGLLRFAGNSVPYLVLALDDRFKALGDASSFEAKEVNGQWDTMIPVYGMGYHTFIKTGDMREEDFLRKQAIYARFLARKLLEDIRDGNKIFVYNRREWLHDEEILVLWAAIRRVGCANLLVTRPADFNHPGGSVSVMGPGLFVGYVLNGDEWFKAWMSICDLVTRMVGFRQGAHNDV